MKIKVSILDGKEIIFSLNASKEIKLNIEEESLNKIDEINDFIIENIEAVEFEKNYLFDDGKNVSKIANKIIELMEKEISEIREKKISLSVKSVVVPDGK